MVKFNVFLLYLFVLVCKFRKCDYKIKNHKIILYFNDLRIFMLILKLSFVENIYIVKQNRADIFLIKSINLKF